jgi:hypothetical protein
MKYESEMTKYYRDERFHVYQHEMFYRSDALDEARKKKLTHQGRPHQDRRSTKASPRRR